MDHPTPELQHQQLTPSAPPTERPPDPPPPPPAKPTASADRIASLDVIRGFALLGIFPMNITAFAMPGLEYMLPAYSGPADTAELVPWIINRFTVEGKMMSLFSILFGAGLILFIHRAKAKGHHHLALHYRRMAWLLLFGLLHAYLLFFGDILVFYALTGMIAVLFHKLRPAILLAIAAAFATIHIAVNGALAALMTLTTPEDLGLSPQFIAQDTAAAVDAANAGFVGRVAHFAEEAFFAQISYPILFLPILLALMLTGMALFKAGILTAKAPTPTLLKVGLPCLIVGLFLTTTSVLSVDTQTPRMQDMFVGMLVINSTAAAITAVAYACFIAIAVKAAFLPTVQRLLANVGRLAFTNYIMQSVIGCIIFYKPGFALFNELSRAQLWLVVLAVWATQLTLSALYLRAFAMGPLEWLWRSLTYAKFLPIPRTKIPTQTN